MFWRTTGLLRSLLGCSVFSTAVFVIAARHGHNNQLTVASVCGGAGSSFCGVGSRRGVEAGVVLTIKDLSMLDSSLLNFSRTSNNSICKPLHLSQFLSTPRFPATFHTSSLFASQVSTAVSSSAIFSSLTSVVFHLRSIFFIPLTLSVSASFVMVRWYRFLAAR